MSNAAYSQHSHMVNKCFETWTALARGELLLLLLLLLALLLRKVASNAKDTFVNLWRNVTFVNEHFQHCLAGGSVLNRAASTCTRHCHCLWSCDLSVRARASVCACVCVMYAVFAERGVKTFLQRQHSCYFHYMRDILSHTKLQTRFGSLKIAAQAIYT